MAIATLGLSVANSPSPGHAYELVQYVEKDPALPPFTLSRPKGWTVEDTTMTQNAWRSAGKALKFSKGNLSIEVGIAPVGDNIEKLDQLGGPKDFATAFANSVARVYAPPNPGNPTPIPNVQELSMEAADDLKQCLAQYKLTVGNSQPILFEQLVGVDKDSEGHAYVYSVTTATPEIAFDRNAKMNAEILRSFKFGVRK